jgi:hypothetical protein
LLTDARSRAAVDAAEKYADNEMSIGEVHAVEEAAAAVVDVTGHEGQNVANDAAHAAAVCLAVWAQTYWGTFEAMRLTADLIGLNHQSDLVRCIFGIPQKQQVTVDPAWLTWNHATVPAIARHIYDDRAFHDLPILADALEDAGCTDPDILAHCRADGEHVRGCWVVDLILGKT